MTRRIVTVALLAWAGIIALAWWLAQARIDICRYDPPCVIRTTAARDYVLIAGLIAVFGAFLIAALIGLRKDYWPKIEVRNGERASEARNATNALRTTSSAVGRIASGVNRRPLFRFFTTVVFGMVLAAGLLWSAGALQLGEARVSSRDGQAQPDPFADLVPRVRPPASGTPAVEADTSQAEPADANAAGDQSTNIEDE